MLLTCVGIFGVLAAQVAQRTHEFGIRMALGAQKTDILQMVLAELTGVLVSGVVIGLAVSMVLTKLAGSLLFGVQPLDPFAFTLAVMALTAAALMAAYLPARQATIVDPAEALRVER
jgi:putative ABC transport system permease protein